MLAALFATSEITPPPGEHAKRRRVREEDEARERKKECFDMEAARRASINYKEARKIRVVKLAARASISRDVETAGGTTDSIAADEDTT